MAILEYGYKFMGIDTGMVFGLGLMTKETINWKQMTKPGFLPYNNKQCFIEVILWQP